MESLRPNEHVLRDAFSWFKGENEWYASGINNAEHSTVRIMNRAGDTKTFRLGKKIRQYRNDRWLYEILDEVKAPKQSSLF